MKGLFSLILFFAFVSCQSQTNPKVSLVVLGTVQDGGSPHIGCKRTCCRALFKNPDPNRKVVSLGVIDHENDKTYLFEATPNITSQLKLLKEIGQKETEIPNGIFLTHAHIGHYTGLMYLGREALGSNSTPVYAMPKMKSFLETNGPWSQLVLLKNITLHEIKNGQEVTLTNNLSVIPIKVPHRDEFSETVGYKIMGPDKTVLFIPDIDKWSRWEKSILKEIQNVDLAFLDATFFDGKEIKNRDMSEIPHPFAIESIALFKSLSNSDKKKVYFIHFNHTNPLLNHTSKEAAQVLQNGLNFSSFRDVFRL